MKLPFDMDLKDKTVIITGGGGVLCGMFAKALAKTGAKIAILDLNLDAANRVAAEIEKDGGIAKGYAANVLDIDIMRGVRDEIAKDFGICDILINGAGGNNPKGTTTKEYLFPEDVKGAEDIVTFFDLDPAGISFVFNLNFLGTLIPTQVFAKDMAENGGGCIVNISSMNAFCPLTKIPAYSGAKAAVSNFTQWLAVHFSKVGIRVNAIAPGFFVTNQNRGMLINADGSYSARAEKIVSQTPMGRFGEPEELIGTLEFLINEDAASFVNGVVIPVDGGFSAYSGV